jgi:plasmid stabilization system protein ParE
MSVVVLTTPEADEQADRLDDWWRANREKAPNLFREELQHAVALLASTPDMGLRYRRRRIPGLRRLLLPLTKCHVYYVHDENAAMVIMLGVGSAIRRRGPELGRL